MRKSQIIQLVLVSAALVACHDKRRDREEDSYYGSGSNMRTNTQPYYHGGYWYARPYSSAHTYNSSSSNNGSHYSNSSSHGYSSSSRGGFGSSAHFSSGS